MSSVWHDTREVVEQGERWKKAYGLVLDEGTHLSGNFERHLVLRLFNFGCGWVLCTRGLRYTAVLWGIVSIVGSSESSYIYKKCAQLRGMKGESFSQTLGWIDCLMSHPVT